ncbi:MAG: hypothetical protein FWG40_00915 [Peptococcaceae bacterium]|nr:hypothetical protein [Peptococcaceae bacterium]
MKHDLMSEYAANQDEIIARAITLKEMVSRDAWDVYLEIERAEAKSAALASAIAYREGLELSSGGQFGGQFGVCPNILSKKVSGGIPETH